MKTFTLTKDFDENGIKLKKGQYSLKSLIEAYGDENKFNYCLQATSLKEYLIENIETPEDNSVVENLEQSNEIETQNIENIETPEDNLVVETKIKPNKKSSKK